MTKRINMALQGGGAHGAFTWGVLDRLLEEPGIEIAGISGTSAGALNGAALKAGLVAGGRDGARANLDWLWEQVGAVGDLRMVHWMSAFLPAASQLFQTIEAAMPVSPGDVAAQLYSPYLLGPFYRNPLERVVSQFHFERVCHAAGPQLYISATNVRTGKIRVFAGAEITTEVILASACLPTVFQAIEFDDPATGRREAFWDGGYAGNPALFPLFGADLPDDIVIVNINPLLRDEVPFTAQDIQNRINEISFNASLLRELRAIGFVKRLIGEGAIRRGQMKDVLIHMIADDALMTELTQSSKLVATPWLLSRLKEAGRTAADRFLDHHGDSLNRAGTVDLVALYQ